MSQGPSHILLGQDGATEQLLPTAQRWLDDGHQVMLVASYASSGEIADLEAWQALKNRYLDNLVLTYVLREEVQAYDLLAGLLDSARLDRLIPNSVQALAIAGGVTWASDLAAHFTNRGLAAADILQFVDEPAVVAADDPRPVRNGITRVTVVQYEREHEFDMDLDGSTVLDAAEVAGLNLPYSCRGGICSTCRVRVLVGAVDMLANDSLDDWEVQAGFVLACQAVPTTPRLRISYDEV